MIALVVVAAPALTACANQKLADEQPTIRTANAPRARAVAMIAHRQPRPTFEERDTAKPAQASQASVPDHEEKTASIPPDAASSVPASSPDPRTVRALNCRDQMFKQHPPVRFGSNGNAAAQRDYFDSCMRQAGTVR